jgi:GMP synthase (glutamine-hydrolysing)
MKKLFILKVGTTFPETFRQLGDFDDWTLACLGPAAANTKVMDVEHGAPLPAISRCAGVIVTGSHAMVTEDLPWSVQIETWIPEVVAARVPFLGICYGHQLLARAMGGEVGFHPAGKEIGTVQVRRLPASDNDPVFAPLPEHFLAHVTHAQSVLHLPPNAICLAMNDFEPHHAFRVGKTAWGVQFHPEYDTRVMRSYIREQAEGLESSGRDVAELLAAVRETPWAMKVLQRFVDIILFD